MRLFARKYRDFCPLYLEWEDSSAGPTLICDVVIIVVVVIVVVFMCVYAGYTCG